MASWLWYTWLSAICFGVTVFVAYRKRKEYELSTLAVYYLFVTCITWIGEFVALGLFDSYEYKPGIFTDQWAENLAGHLFLNASMFPAAAFLITLYPQRLLMLSSITAFFLLAEYLFESLGIYEQHWWKYYMSAINVIIFMTIARKWFEKIKHPQYNIPRLLTFYFVGFLIIHTPFPFLLLLRKQHYSIEMIFRIVGNMYRTSIMFIFSYHLIETAVIVYFVCVLGKWYWKLLPFVMTAAVQTALAKMNILILTEGWKLIYTIALYWVCLAVFMLLEKYTLRPG